MIAAIQLVSGATVNHVKREVSTLQRDRLFSQSLGDIGATIKCLLELESPEINDNIYNIWNEHFERIQLHPTKPVNPDQSIEVLHEKSKVTLNKLQSINSKCSSLPYVCRDDANKSENNAPNDLKDMANSLQMLASTMQCALNQTADLPQLHLIFDSSLERMHSNYDAVATPLSKVYEEILQSTIEIRKLNTNCENVDITGKVCV